MKRLVFTPAARDEFLCRTQSDSLRSVLDPDYAHHARSDEIADDVWIDDSKFGGAAAGGPAALRMVLEAVGGVGQPLRHFHRGERTISADVGADRHKIGGGSSGSDDLNHDSGAGLSSGVPQVFNQARISSCGTTRPAFMSASPSESAAASASASSSSKKGSGVGMTRSLAPDEGGVEGRGRSAGAARGGQGARALNANGASFIVSSTALTTHTQNKTR